MKVRANSPAPLILGVLLLAAADLCAADKIRISSINPTAFDIDYTVAREKGFFAKENLEVEPTYMTPDLVIKALIAGTVDLARSGTHCGIIAAVRGAEIKIIGGPGLAEMIRLLEYDNLIPKCEPWEAFVDSSFISKGR